MREIETTYYIYIILALLENHTKFSVFIFFFFVIYFVKKRKRGREVEEKQGIDGEFGGN